MLRSEGFSCGKINIVLCSDNYLLHLNRKYLKREYLTDIITFKYGIDKIISGDLFISIDRIIENSEIFSASFQNELFRVIVHGILHLIGYNDSTPEEIALMRIKENYYLSIAH